MIILLIVAIKYKPVYEINLSGEKLGYVENKDNIELEFENYIEDTSGNVAFKEKTVNPEYELKLVSRNTETSEESDILLAIENTVKVIYRTYAVTVGGEKKTSVSTVEEATEIVENVKSDVDSETIGLDIGIVEEYSEDLELQSKEEAFEVLNSEKIAKVTAYNEQQEAVRKAEEEAAKQKAIQKQQAALAVKTVAPGAVVGSIAGLNLSRPVSGVITSRFGSISSRRSSAHTGLDIGAALGTSVTPIASGTVTFAGWKGSYGNLVIINHGNGIESYYAHCNTINVGVGQSVDTGTVISTVGSTGNSTGSHLHLEIRLNGTPLNPEDYLY